MDAPPTFPDLPGWRFSLEEISNGAWRAQGQHADGRSVSRTSSDVTVLIREVVDDAKYLAQRRDED